LQHKFDDFVSVRDFGAKGDGTTDDTAAINRAISQIYPSSETVTNTKARRTIYFPAGTYIISDTIIAPPWLRIVGDGLDSTIIRQDNAAVDYVLRTADSAFEYGTNIGATPFIQMPTDISVENLTLQQNTTNGVVFIDSAINVSFKSVKFSGVFDWTTTPLLAYAGVKFNNFKVANSGTYNFGGTVTESRALTGDGALSVSVARDRSAQVRERLLERSVGLRRE
jgi:polygalacturonase